MHLILTWLRLQRTLLLLIAQLCKFNTSLYLHYNLTIKYSDDRFHAKIEFVPLGSLWSYLNLKWGKDENGADERASEINNATVATNRAYSASGVTSSRMSDDSKIKQAVIAICQLRAAIFLV